MKNWVVVFDIASQMIYSFLTENGKGKEKQNSQNGNIKIGYRASHLVRVVISIVSIPLFLNY